MEPLEQRRLLAATPFSITPYVQDPTIIAASGEDPTTASVVIMWEVEEDEYHNPCPDALNYVEYRVAGIGEFIDSGDENDGGDINSDDWIAEIELSDLLPNTTYEFRVRSKADTYDWGWSPSESTAYSFKTFPDPDADPSDPGATPNEFRFAAYGDNRSNAGRHGQVVADIVGGVSPAFVLHVGDLVDKGQRNRSEWNTEYFTPADGLLTGEVYTSSSSSSPAVPVIPVKGNHEYMPNQYVGTHWYDRYMHTADDGANNEDYFAFTYGNVRVIGLNTNYWNDGTRILVAPDFREGSDQYNWLVAELQSTEYQNADWHVVYFHQPAYTHATNHPESPQIKAHLVPLFEEYGMDLVFYGHNHCYERYRVLNVGGIPQGRTSDDDPNTTPNDVNYILTGGGGAPGNAEKSGDPSPNRIEGRFDGTAVLHHTTMDVNVAERTLDYNAVFVYGTSFGPLNLSRDYTFRDGLLTVYGDGTSSTITIASVGDATKFVTVNDKRVAGVETSQVTQIVVNGTSIAETIDLSAVTIANGFTSSLNGNVRISGEGGDDTITGSEFGDTYVFSGSSNLGTDTITEQSDGGTDTLDFSDADFGSGVEVDLGDTGTQVVVTSYLSLILSDDDVIENIVGSGEDDLLEGNSLPNALTGGAGDDSLVGGGGDDTYVFSGSTNLGTDAINEDSDEGTDTLDFSGADFGSGVVVDLGDTGTQVVVTSYLSLILSDDDVIENIVGSDQDDLLEGNSLPNVLVGGAGDDTFVFSGSNLGTDSINPVDGDSFLEDGDTILVADDAVAGIQGDFTMDGTYVSQIGSSASVEYPPGYDPEDPDFRPPILMPSYGEYFNGQVNVLDADAYLAGELQLPALTKLAPAFEFDPEDPNPMMIEWWGEQTRTILSAEGQGTISGSFETVPEAQPDGDWGNPDPINNPVWSQGHLGRGVFLTRENDGGEDDELGVSYSAAATKVHLFQAADGDTNGDCIVNSFDIMAIMASGGFPNEPPPLGLDHWDWQHGDFDGNGAVNSFDIMAIMAAGMYPFLGGPYYDPPEGRGAPERGVTGGGELRPGVPGGGSSESGRTVDLIVTADGLMIDTHGETVGSWVFSSAAGVFTGDPAKLLGAFWEDSDGQIGSAFFTLTGQHFLGDVIGEEYGGVDPLEDLTLQLHALRRGGHLHGQRDRRDGRVGPRRRRGGRRGFERRPVCVAVSA